MLLVLLPRRQPPGLRSSGLGTRAQAHGWFMSPPTFPSGVSWRPSQACWGQVGRAVSPQRVRPQAVQSRLTDGRCSEAASREASWVVAAAQASPPGSPNPKGRLIHQPTAPISGSCLFSGFSNVGFAIRLLPSNLCSGKAFGCKTQLFVMKM